MENTLKSWKAIEIENLTLPPLAVRVQLGNVDSLADSFKECGVLEPLIVRPSKADIGKFEVVCGCRRYHAARKAGLKTVPCVVREMDDREAMEAMFAENLQREALTDYEAGRWFKLLREKFPGQYPSLNALAERFGFKGHAAVSRLISHYEFLEKIGKELPPDIVPRGTMLPEAMIREVRRAPEHIQAKLVKAIVRTFEKFERGEYPYPPGVRDVATLVDSYVATWKREKVEGEKRTSKIGKPEASATPVTLTPASASTVETVAPRLVAAEMPQEKVEAQLQTVIEKRREEAKKTGKEETEKAKEEVLALYVYYPENFMGDVESMCGPDTPLEKVRKLARYAVEIVWDQLTPEAKMKVLREAWSWMG